MRNNNMILACQTAQVRDASALVPRNIARLYRLRGFFKKHGCWATLQKILQSIVPARPALENPASPAHSAVEEALHLQPGEWVEVKSYDEIRQTLDADQRHRGLLFMTEMATFCGRRFQVYKPVTRILMEETAEVRRLQNTVLLTGSHCSGLSVGCDRACFHFWREAWLRRI